MFQQKLAVAMADGAELIAVVDQRDLAAAEAKFPDGIGRFTQARFLAWSALSREKSVSDSWEKFNSVSCIEAHDPKPDEVEALDPTQPGASVESS